MTQQRPWSEARESCPMDQMVYVFVQFKLGVFIGKLIFRIRKSFPLNACAFLPIVWRTMNALRIKFDITGLTY